MWKKNNIIYSLGFSLGLFFIFNGCVSKEIEYLPQIMEKEVLIPYIPPLPEVNCEFKGNTDQEVIQLMLKCISLQKKVLSSLRVNDSFNLDYLNQKETSNGIFNSK